MSCAWSRASWLRRNRARGRSRATTRSAAASSAGPETAASSVSPAARARHSPSVGIVSSAAVQGQAGYPYEPGLLALREGPLLEAAVRALPVMPDVLLVNATGRDHPLRAGLALHLGAVLELPTVGVTHRPVLAGASRRRTRWAPEAVDDRRRAGWLLGSDPSPRAPARGTPGLAYEPRHGLRRSARRGRRGASATGSAGGTADRPAHTRRDIELRGSGLGLFVGPCCQRASNL